MTVMYYRIFFLDILELNRLEEEEQSFLVYLIRRATTSEKNIVALTLLRLSLLCILIVALFKHFYILTIILLNKNV